MPSQFSAIGFDVSSGEDLAALATRAAERAATVAAQAGQYLKWASPGGEQLWLQLTHEGDAMGMTPHFAGKSVMRVALEARVHRPSHTPLEGTFLAWANPRGAAAGGDYPFVFDCPDAGVHASLELPAIVDVQLAAFAQQVTLYDSPEAYDAAREAEGLAFASRSFIPSGLFSPDGEPVNPPEPHALFVGHVIEVAVRRNALSGQPYCWALVDTLGGVVDVVIDPALLSAEPQAGNVVSGWFWLSGRLQMATEAPRRSWWQRLADR